MSYNVEQNSACLQGEICSQKRLFFPLQVYRIALHCKPMKPKRVPHPINVRVSDKTKERLDILAARCGLTASDLLRTALAEKLTEWEMSGVVILVRRA
jgi:hypothetical protein